MALLAFFSLGLFAFVRVSPDARADFELLMVPALDLQSMWRPDRSGHVLE
jgi:hypothetical protein